MKELNRTDRLTIATLIIAIILVIGLVTLKKPAVEFTLTTDETVNLITSSNDIILPEEVTSIVNQSDNKYFLVDVRNPVDYQKSHIGQAVNIPIQEILQSHHLDTFNKLSEEGVTIMLYGKDLLEANGAWLVLKQTGFDKMRVMSGGFDYYQGNGNNSSHLSGKPGYKAEESGLDFKAILDSLGSPAGLSEKPATEPVKIIKREKKSATEGGC